MNSLKSRKLVSCGISVCVMVFAVGLLMTSCYKRSYVAYFHNQTEQDVVVEWGFVEWNEAPCRYHVPADEAVEMLEGDHWYLMTHSPLADSVVFTYADGTRVVHRYYTVIDSLGCGTRHFEPETNNIFAHDLDPNPAWTLQDNGHNQMRYDYYIR